MTETANVRSLTMLNEQGDVTIVWTEDGDDEMERAIEKKMAEGVAFFIVEPRFFGLLPPKRTPLERASDAHKHRALSVRDEDFAKLVNSGSVDLVRTSDEPISRSRKAKTAKEAAQSQTVGVRARKGG